MADVLRQYPSASYVNQFSVSETEGNGTESVSPNPVTGLDLEEFEGVFNLRMDTKSSDSNEDCESFTKIKILAQYLRMIPRGSASVSSSLKAIAHLIVVEKQLAHFILHQEQDSILLYLFESLAAEAGLRLLAA